MRPVGGQLGRAGDRMVVGERPETVGDGPFGRLRPGSLAANRRQTDGQTDDVHEARKHDALIDPRSFLDATHDARQTTSPGRRAEVIQAM
jgi:hypothetical protein